VQVLEISQLRPVKPVGHSQRQLPD